MTGTTKTGSASHSAQGNPDRGTHRVETFSDGFFAIVITLLVLDLKLPEDGTSMVPALRAAWTVILAYVISFVNIYILWVVHHELMRITTRADTKFLYLNGLMLLGIAIMPFSTSVLAANVAGPDGTYAAALYSAVFLWVAIFLNILWRYLAAHPDRLLPSVTTRDRRRISRTYGLAAVLYALAFGLAWIAPLFSVGLTMALAMFFGVIDRISGFASEDVAAEGE